MPESVGLEVDDGKCFVASRVCNYCSVCAGWIYCIPDTQALTPSPLNVKQENDMTTTVNVEVTEKDIAEGVRHSCANCPVAIAASRALARPVETSYFYLHFGPPLFLCSKLPSVVREFVVAFDRQGSVAPFSFPLDIPSEFVKAVQS